MAKTKKAKAAPVKPNAHAYRTPKRPKGIPEGERLARAQTLPGVDNRLIAEIEDCVGELAEIRDRRERLRAAEKETLANLLKAMRRHKRTSYARPNGLEIKIVAGEAALKIHLPPPPPLEPETAPAVEASEL